MEEVDGLFSSPEKSPVKSNGFGEEDDDSSIGSDGMSMDEGMLNQSWTVSRMRFLICLA